MVALRGHGYTALDSRCKSGSAFIPLIPRVVQRGTARAQNVSVNSGLPEQGLHSQQSWTICEFTEQGFVSRTDLQSRTHCTTPKVIGRRLVRHSRAGQTTSRSRHSRFQPIIGTV
uniref:(northern house mosquito) hypothetical protein n=1 Tax=Culex pipiens TaxID=7175 RepID=A0A8D8FZV7_CULPI